MDSSAPSGPNSTCRARSAVAVVAVMMFGSLWASPSVHAADDERTPALDVQAAYYVDSREGDDANSGTSAEEPWRTLAKAQQAPLGPGSAILLKRGGDWGEKLTVSSSGLPGAPILLGSYGTGALPRVHTGGCLDLLGSYIDVQAVHTDSCKWAGISISGSHNVVRNSAATGNVTGIYVRPGATSNRILANELHDNNRMSVVTAEPGDDSGAWGVLVRGDGTEVAYNRITGSDAFSYDFARDGAAIEVYGGRDNVVHHNRAIDNNMFSELGHSRSANNVFAYNLVVSQLERGGFLTTRGADSRYGPVMATGVYNNSVLLKGSFSQGIVCHAGCHSGILRMRNNVIQAVLKAGYADAPFDDGNGVYFGGRIQFDPGPGSEVIAPQFVDPATGDLHLLRSSPGVDGGDPSVPHFGTDLDGRAVPADGTGDGVAIIDVGAYELSSGPIGLPSPSPVSFCDTAGHAHEESIAKIAAAGIAHGSQGCYRPDEPVTRGQMATFLQRSYSLAAGTSNFCDVAGHAHEPGITAVTHAGIAHGSNGCYRPDEPVTRGQMATFLARAEGLEPGPGNLFCDVSGHTHEASTGAVAAAGIAQGNSGCYRPDDAVTRGQMATFLVRALQL